MNGYVNFPVNDQEYKNSGEGGLFVLLVVPDEWPVDFMECHGNTNYVMYNENLVGADVEEECDCDECESLVLVGLERRGVEHYHFPSMDEREFNYRPHIHDGGKRLHFPLIKVDAPKFNPDPYLSVSYLAIVNLGSTSWSGWNEEKGNYFVCTYNDLNEEGKTLYNSIKTLYPKGKLVLQTWLDT